LKLAADISAGLIKGIAQAKGLGILVDAFQGVKVSKELLINYSDLVICLE